MKNSFVLYIDYLESIEDLTMEQAGSLFLAILRYQSEKELPQMDAATKMAFNFIRSQLDKDNQKWMETVEKRREAGKLGGRPKAKKANGFSEKQTKAKKADNDNVNVNVNDHVNGHDIKKKISAKADTKKEEESHTAIQIPLNDETTFNVTLADVERYSELYQGISVMDELRKMVGWCEANPKNRKTRLGVKRFIAGWLCRAQDKARVIKDEKPKNKFNQFQQNDYDFEQLENELLSNGAD